MSTVADDDTVRSSTSPARLVVNRVVECYRPDSQPRRARSQLRYGVAHMTSLSKRTAANPHPVPDAYANMPALAARFVANLGLGTGGWVPYHGGTLVDATNEQSLPLLTVGAHAHGYNTCSVGWAIVGEDGPATFEQLSACAGVFAALTVYCGGLEVVGHTDLPGASTDPAKTCPRPTIDIVQLRALVRDHLPAGWQLMTPEEREQYALGVGFVL